MTNPTPLSDSDRLISVADVKGVQPSVREHVSRTSADVESATAALRDALHELHQSEDEAWRGYAAELEDATRRFDSTVGLASARLRAAQADSQGELRDALTEVASSWRSRAEEIRVQLHIGRMDARDRGEETVSDLEQASQRIGALLNLLRDEVGESMVIMRNEARSALDEAARILQGR